MCDVSDAADVSSLWALRALDDVELDLLVLFQVPEAGTRDRRVVDEHVGLAALDGNEPETLSRVNPFPVPRALRPSFGLPPKRNLLVPGSPAPARTTNPPP